jgi:tripartite-type tricarboxylate transporter receptor subunit TctC
MIRRMTVWISVVAFALIAVTAPTTAALAQEYPSRLVTLVVPYPAGGGLDVFARMLAKPLADRLGRSVVVDNRPGGGATIGASYVANAVPDGYTLMLGTSTPLAIAVSLHKKLPYDPLRDFVPVALVANAPFLLVVNSSLNVRTVNELVTLAKNTPAKLSYGSAGPGSPQHLSMELLKSITGMELVHVPYKGDAPAITDLLAGHIPMQFAEATPALPLIASGKVRALGVSAMTRIPNAPDIPPLAEAGAPGFDFVSWQMIVVPAGTAKPIVDRLHAEFKDILALPEIEAEFVKTGRISVNYLTIDELRKFMATEVSRLGKIVERAGIAHSE